MSYRIYPVVPTELCCNDYTVKINGETVTSNTARVSAVPFNRRWPGHQRQIEQTEALRFLSLASDEPLTFEITPSRPFEKVKIRPRSPAFTTNIPRVARDAGGKISDFTFENIYVYGNKLPRCRFVGYDETHKVRNVFIKNLRLNGKAVENLTGENWIMEKYTENIAKKNDKYTQMSKNTVDSKGQLKETEMVKFDRPDGNGCRVTFVGNSITLHGAKPDIGWNNAWGMAASAKENDYVHIIEKAILERSPDASFCICQAASWERSYKNGSETYTLYESARDFNADIIIFRCIENCPGKDFEPDVFKRELDAFLGYLNKNKKAKLIITTGFWHHPGDDVLRSYAEEKWCPCVELGDLGEQDEMKAIGLFEHSGVANHPGDAGMKAIADRIITELIPLI